MGRSNNLRGRWQDRKVALGLPLRAGSVIADSRLRIYIAGPQSYLEALEYYTNSLRHDTSKAVVWANRSATLLAMQRPEEALRDAQISRSIDKEYSKASNFLQ